MDNFWLFAVLGFIGVVIHVVVKTMEAGGRTLATLWVYIKENNLSVVLSTLTYAALIVLWWSVGLEVMGFEAGKLTGATVLVAYMSTSLFKTIAETRTNAKNGTAIPGATP